MRCSRGSRHQPQQAYSPSPCQLYLATWAGQEPFFCVFDQHKGLAAAVVLSGLSVSPLLFSALEVAIVNPDRLPFTSIPYPLHPYERYLEDPEALERIPRLFWCMGCCCLLLSPAAFLLNSPQTVVARYDSRASSNSMSSFVALAATAENKPPSPGDPLEQQQQHPEGPSQPKHPHRNPLSSCSSCSKAESAGARKTQEELQLLPTYKSGSSTAGLFSLWLVYVLLGLSVHLTGIFWEATAAALKALCFSLTILFGCCTAAVYGQLLSATLWLFLFYLCVGGLSVTLPLVIAEVANPDDFSYLYTLAYTSKPASACLSSLLLTLLYPSVGLSGCTALAAISASLALLLCSYVPKGMYRGIAL
ncbi:major facilitator family protein [Cyclospora cayetanensis]|uniref:Major facilitator family protein n=1 Tax=Cyclospora cayetanensis TaxID=88456 RepID=A0A1D3D3M6_9EIME|nr:major facilitator family protein [Cyclospora cayetanensis]